MKQKTKKPYRPFFPFQALYVYIPLHMYAAFKIAGLIYNKQSLGFALIPIAIFSFVSAPVLYILVDVSLYYFFGRKTCKEHLQEKFKGLQSETASLKDKVQENLRLDLDESDEFGLRKFGDRKYEPKKFHKKKKKFHWANVKKGLIIFFTAYLFILLYANRHLVF